MARLARTLFIAVALPAVAAAAEQRDWLITGQIVPRAPDLLSRNLTPPPLDLATTQIAPGQWLYLPPAPRPIPQAELDQASSGGMFGAGGSFVLGKTDSQLRIGTPDIGRYSGFDLCD